MKKLLLVLLILLLLFGGYLLYSNNDNKKIPMLEVEEETINIDQLFIYGNHLNMHGTIINEDNLELVLYNGDFITYDINVLEDGFNLSNNVNEGILLDSIPIGKYYLFLRANIKDNNGNISYKYFALKNETSYKETEYYTFSNVGNKIIIGSDDNYKTIMMSVIKSKNDDVYDVVVDPGHGGMDSGATKYGYMEADFTMKLAISLKEKLEAYGVRVKLTREDGQLTKNDKLANYGIHGRAVIPYEVKAKYIFSIHLNSSNYSSSKGIEIYTADNINYDFAKQLGKNIVELATTNYSKNPDNRVFDGIYTRTFTKSDINESLKEYNSKKMNPYDITTKSNYYFIIRETGGIITGAYVDDRNVEVGNNPYYNSNVGCESYLLELGYITNKSDVNNISNNLDKYTEAIANSFKTVFVK